MSLATSSSRDPRSDWRLLRLLWPYARRHLKLLLAALAFLPPLALADAVQPLILQRALDGPIAQAFAQGDSGILAGLWPYAGLLLLTLLARWVFQPWKGIAARSWGS